MLDHYYNIIVLVKISVVIATFCRPGDLKRCLESIQRLSFGGDWEVVVVEQGRSVSKKIVESLCDERFRYLFCKKQGKSVALNKGISISKGKYLAFTDDDCLVSENWLKNAVLYLDENIKISGVFGNVWPYEPEEHLGEYCPSIFTEEREVVVENPKIIHHVMLGSGNNMIWRREVVLKVRGFNEHLGPGTWVGTGEDGDLVKRILLRGGNRVAFISGVDVWHNRWLSKREYEENAGRYTRGSVVIGSQLWDQRLRHKFNDFRLSTWKAVVELYYVVWEVYNIIFGLFLRKVLQLLDQAGKR